MRVAIILCAVFWFAVGVLLTVFSPVAKADMFNPANPIGFTSPISPNNPLSPFSPMNPNGLYHQNDDAPKQEEAKTQAPKAISYEQLLQRKEDEKNERVKIVMLIVFSTLIACVLTFIIA